MLRRNNTKEKERVIYYTTQVSCFCREEFSFITLHSKQSQIQTITLKYVVFVVKNSPLSLYTIHIKDGSQVHEIVS